MQGSLKVSPPPPPGGDGGGITEGRPILNGQDLTEEVPGAWEAPGQQQRRSGPDTADAWEEGSGQEADGLVWLAGS